MPGSIQLPTGLRLLRKIRFPKKLGTLELLYGKALASRGINWVKCANGTTWKLDLSDSLHRWIVYGYYEGGPGIKFARKALEGGGVFVDSGANIGQWLLYLGSIKGVKAIEIEPVKSQRLWLEECVELQSNWTCRILPFGLGSNESSAEIQCWGARSTLRGDWYTTKNFPRERVSIRKLDNVLDEASIEIVDFWKLDVEGAEYEALLGAQNHLKAHKIKNLYFECIPSSYRPCKTLLEGFGYQIFDIGNQGIRPKKDSELKATTDLVALPK